MQKEYKQFDFWLGNWKVYDKNNKLIGTNHVVVLPNACGIQENWTSKTSASLGTSYNYYNKKDNTWNQVWIDNTGFSLVLKGKYDSNKMVLKSEPIKREKDTFYNRITWTKNSNGTVTQVWEYVLENGKTVNEVFRGIYKK